MDGQSFISKYAIMQRLGTGGMAEVFKCKLSGVGGFEKIVVIKRILPHLMEDENFISMFLDEARIAANLTHPNIVQVSEIAQDDEDVPFIVMEYVRGPTLSQLIKKAAKARDLSLVHMVRLASGAALGLDYAHNAKGPEGQLLNIVHRDVSPQNIMVSLDGTAKILDFGVAKANGRLTHTKGGIVKGKLRYMAPEQIADPEGALDRRADVYSLGVCLYLSTTGRLPFMADNDVDTMKLIMSGMYPKPSDLIPGYPPELELIVDWSLRGDREARTPSCKDLADALTEWADAAPGSSQADTAAWLAQTLPEVDSDSWGGGSTSGLSRLTGYGARPGWATTPSGRYGPLLPPRGTPVGNLHPGNFNPGNYGPADPNAYAPQPDLPAGAPGDPYDFTGVVSMEPPAKSRVPLFAGLGVAGACLVAAIVVVALKKEPPPPPPPPLPPPVAVVPVVAPPPLEHVKPYLDEGQRLLEAGKLARAKEQLEKARRRGQLTVEEDSRLSTLEGDLHTALWLDAAAHAIDEGKLDDARKQLQQVEEDDPSNARAKELRELISKKVAEAAPPPATTPPPPPTNGKPAPPPVRPSVLSVNSEPAGASVYVDGDPVGTTPLTGATLRPGPHLIEVRRKGLLPASQMVTGAGAPVALQFSLSEAVEKRPAPPPPPPPPPPAEEQHPKLKVTSSVRAQLSVDGASVGSTPFETGTLKAGKHSLAASAEGFETETREVELKAGEAQAIAFELRKVPAQKAAEPPPPAPEPVPVAKVVEPPPPAAAQAPVVAAPQAPDLAKVFPARTVQEVAATCKKVEEQAITKGSLTPPQVRATTSFLGRDLAKAVGPSDPVDMFPTGMYWFIVKAAQSGKAPQQIAKDLRAAHFAGELTNLGP